jgi:hypothetical protein
MSFKVERGSDSLIMATGPDKVLIISVTALQQKILDVHLGHPATLRQHHCGATPLYQDNHWIGCYVNLPHIPQLRAKPAGPHEPWPGVPAPSREGCHEAISHRFAAHRDRRAW